MHQGEWRINVTFLLQNARHDDDGKCDECYEHRIVYIVKDETVLEKSGLSKRIIIIIRG